MKAKLLLLLCLLLFSAPSSGWTAQACSDEVPETTPEENFLAQEDGTLYGKNTGLVWMRCSLGQKWTGQDCAGEAVQFNWLEALKAAAAHQHAGFEDWRLPNKNELESIVELSCSVPAINEQLFPSAAPAFYWSSSPYGGVADGAWSVDFAYGAVVASVKSGKNYVRLVRNR